MKRLLVTGADGFVGRWLVRAARAREWDVIAAISTGDADPSEWLTASERSGVSVVRGDLRDTLTIRTVVESAPAAVVHLAAIASGTAARRDPTLAWTVNAGVTATLADALSEADKPLFLLASTGEVYGRGHAGPISEDAALAPVSPYAATKVGAEAAAMECHRRTGLPVMIARPFPHTGPGQNDSYVFPALARRLRDAMANGAGTIAVGNLSPVRDLLDVRDVVTAYLAILEAGVPGEAYNIASGAGMQLTDALATIARLLGSQARPVVDPSLMRSADIPVLIGDARKLGSTTGWAPRISLDRTFQDLVDAQAH